MTASHELAALVRHLRYASGMTQQALAAAAEVGLSTVERWESGTAAAPPLQRAALAMGAMLWAVPAPAADPELEARQLGRLAGMHPLDRVQEVVLADRRPIAGVSALRWLHELDELAWSPVLVTGPAAALFWLPTLEGRPIVERMTVVAPEWWERPPGQRGRLDVVRSATLPTDALRTAQPVGLGAGGLRVLHPAGLMLTTGWDPELARAAILLDRVALRDGGGRRASGPRRQIEFAWHDLERRWPSRQERLVARPLPPRASRALRPPEVRAERERARRRLRRRAAR